MIRPFSLSQSIPVVCMAAACGVFVANDARAQDAAAAEALFQDGLAALKASNVEVACTRFAESDRLDPAVGTKLALADCEERRGRTATAWALYRAAFDKLPSTDARAPKVRERIDRLEPKLAKLVIELAVGAPSELEILRDGNAMRSGVLGVALPVDPGAHVVVVRAPGADDATFEATAVEGKTVKLTVAPGPAKPIAIEPAPKPVVVAPTTSTNPPSSAAPPRPEPASPREVSAGTSGWTVFGISSMIVGGLAGVGGAISLSLAHDDAAIAAENCNDEVQLCNAVGREAIDRGQLENTLGGVGLAVGGAGLALGAVGLVLGSHSRDAPVDSARAGCSPTVGGARCGVWLAW
jgi:hypothetical protein